MKNGRPELPHLIAVVDQPVVNTITPVQGTLAGGDFVTISGSNFKAGASVTFGGAVAGDVNVLSSNQLTCQTPAHFPGTVDVAVTNPGGSSAALLQSFTYIGNTISLALPDTGGGQGAAVQVPINVADVNGLVAAELTISFDSTVLTGVGASTGNLTPGWSLSYNASVPGQIVLALISPSGPVSGDGVLAYLDFDVIGAPGAGTELAVTGALFNDGDLDVDAQNGSFTVDQIYNVSGQVQFWNGGVVPATAITLDGDRLYTTLSGTDGHYALGGAANGGYVLSAAKGDNVDGISAYDASLVLQHTVGLNLLTGSAATAGDVNRNGAINSMDAYYILQKAVELVSLPFPGAGSVWAFTPPSYAINSLTGDLTGQNFTGLIYGDVSGNWTPPAQTAARFYGDLPQILIEPPTSAEDGSIQVAIALDPAGMEAYSVELDLRLDPRHAMLVAAEPVAATTGWMVSVNQSEAGRLRIAMAGAAPVTTADQILMLRFDGESGADGLAMTLAGGMVNETNLTVAQPDGLENQLFLPMIQR